MNVDPEKLTNFICLTGAAISEAEQTMEKAAAEKTLVDAAIPQVVKALIAGGYIAATSEKHASEALAGHANTLELLRRVAEKQAPDAPKPIGKPIAKTAADNRGIAAAGTKPDSWERFGATLKSLTGA
jgi:hypothetical protein